MSLRGTVAGMLLVGALGDGAWWLFGRPADGPGDDALTAQSDDAASAGARLAARRPADVSPGASPASTVIVRVRRR